MTSSQHDSIPVPAALNNARPLLAALTSWSFSSVHNLADARLMHVLALLGLLVLLSLITFLVRRWDWGFLVVLASTFGLMLPVFEIYIDWAVCWPYTWFAALSIVAWQLWRQKNPFLMAVATLLLTCVGLVYQPLLFFFFAFFAVEIVVTRIDSKSAFRLIARGAALALSASALSMLVARLSMSYWNIDPANRVGFISFGELPGRIYWAITRFLTISLYPFFTLQPKRSDLLLVIVFVLAILLISLVYQARSLKESVPFRGLAVALPLILTMTASLVAKYDVVDVRILPGASFAVVVIVFYAAMRGLIWGIGKVTHSPRESFGSIPQLALAGSVIAVGTALVIANNSYFQDLIYKPLRAKNLFFTSHVKDCFKDGAVSSINLIARTEPLNMYLDRLSPYSISTDIDLSWVAAPSLRMVLDQSGHNLIPINYISQPTQESYAQQNHICKIDLNSYIS